MARNHGKYLYNVGRHIIAILELYAYADESGVEKTPPYCVVAGYIASLKTWDKVRGKWTKTLKDYGIGEFHAKSFFGRYPGHGQYAELSTAETSDLLRRLTTIIQQHRLNPIGSVIDVNAFNTFTVGERRFLTGARLRGGRLYGSGSPRQPYYVPFRYFIQMALDHTPVNAKVHFVFDLQNALSGLATKLYSEMKTSNYLKDNGRLGKIRFADSREKVELQAADIYAHLWYIQAKQHDGLGKMTLERQAALNTLASKTRFIFVHDTDSLEKSLCKPGPAIRAYLHSLT